ncbi:hypothetical protein BTVI_07802 [Pitangus sulphuratus]|nr:hypothetical protein BTVI_07802 [Pitangus sulphuratus]
MTTEYSSRLAVGTLTQKSAGSVLEGCQLTSQEIPDDQIDLGLKWKIEENTFNFFNYKGKRFICTSWETYVAAARLESGRVGREVDIMYVGYE